MFEGGSEGVTTPAPPPRENFNHTRGYVQSFGTITPIAVNEPNLEFGTNDII